MCVDKNGREIKTGDRVRREPDEMGHLAIPSMTVLEILNHRHILTDVRTNGALPAVYLASLCEVIE